VEVSKGLKDMRLSPLLAAALAASATFGISKPIHGQTIDQSPLDIDIEQKEPASSEILPPAGTVSTKPSGSISQSVYVDQNAVSVAVEQQEPTAVNSAVAEYPVKTISNNNVVVETLSVPESASTNPLRAQAPLEPAPAPDTEAQPTEAQPNEATDPRVLVSEVVVQGAEGDLENAVYRAIRTVPGRTTTRSQLQEDVNAVFATGFFQDVEVVPEDTPLGVRITFAVEPNPVLRNVNVSTVPPEGERVLPQDVVDRIFGEQYGRILNLRDLQRGVQELNAYYKEQGFDLAQVVDASQADETGTVTLTVAEGVIENIRVRFLNEDGEATTEEGEPVEGRTRDFIVTREIQLEPGDVFNRQTAERDLRRIFELGIFEDVRLSFEPGTDPRQVDLVVDVIERNTGSIAAGLGISSASGLFGTVSYQEQNLGGNNQTLGAEVQVGQRELLFDVRFTDPWIGGDPYRTSYTVNAFRRRSISLIFDGGDVDVNLPDGDRPRILRTGGGISFSRPLAPDPFTRSPWTASAGLQYQAISVRDSDGNIQPRDELGNPVSFNEDGTDQLLTVQLGAVRDLRNNPLQPTSGSLLRFGVEQSIPLGGIFLNRLRGSYSQYVPVDFTNFSQGPEAFAFNVQAGTVLGDLPPYEAFSLGGSNSVRGYDEGDVGAGRSFIQATAEYRFPILPIIGGAVFVDYASDLGTGDNVPGNPAGVRGKPGGGFGYGVGVRVNSPLGPIRVDYGINDDGDSRIHFGIGERF
jgi:outer membrane protein insertion porin family